MGHHRETFVRPSLPKAAAILVVLHLVGLLVPAPAHACAVCYGDVDSPMTAGVNNGILVLLAVVAAVQIFFVVLFVGMRRRARQVRRETRQFQVTQRGAD